MLASAHHLATECVCFSVPGKHPAEDAPKDDSARKRRKRWDDSAEPITTEGAPAEAVNGHQGPKDGQDAASYWKDLASMGEDSKDEAGPGPRCFLFFLSP